MFGIGVPEMMVIGVVAILVFGPDRLPEFARTAGRLLRQMRQMVSNAQNDLRNELGPEFADLDVRDLNPRSFVRKHLLEGIDDDDNDALDKPVASSVDMMNGRPRLPAGQPAPYDSEAT
ncbi:sec-independent translocase [Kribbella sp. NBC_01245]|uniref:sec-independent translocase n=1 Tax=Kribbella sp. NBC_01245 TaxID=2903578 RepID=UPI002E2CC918|nr:sec-independent translocase [Kribbella sp. NBC_01245]